MTDKRMYTVWQFRSPSTPQVAKVVRVAEPNDMQVQHEFQKVLWRGLAYSAKEAEANA